MILATNNEGKIKEIKQILSDYEIYSLKEKSIFIDIEEDKDTFLGNALKKAIGIYELTNEPVIADDSGLCIDIYDEWPGVFTHRFLGEDASEVDRNIAILDKMKDLNDNERNAKVVCNMVYYDGINTIVGEGILSGKISETMRGSNGFGFDTIFEIDDGRTLAELTDEEKNLISVRYLALIDIKVKLNNILNKKHSFFNKK